MTKWNISSTSMRILLLRIKFYGRARGWLSVCHHCLHCVVVAQWHILDLPLLSNSFVAHSEHMHSTSFHKVNVLTFHGFPQLCLASYEITLCKNTVPFLCSVQCIIIYFSWHVITRQYGYCFWHWFSVVKIFCISWICRGVAQH